MIEADTSQITAAVNRLRSVPVVLTERIGETAGDAGPVWRSLLARHADTRLAQRTIGATGTVAASPTGVRLEAGEGGGSLSGGLPVAAGAVLAEHGAAARVTTYSRRSVLGRAHRVTRATTRQFRAPNSRGYVVAPAAEEIKPKLAEMWNQAAAEVIGEALEGG